MKVASGRRIGMAGGVDALPKKK